MNKEKVEEEDYIQFLIGSQTRYTCTEAQRVSPLKNNPSHDAYNRLLLRIAPEKEKIWKEAKELIGEAKGNLVIDDTLIHKRYSKKGGLVKYQWSGKDKRTEKGIGLVTALWTDGEKIIPVTADSYEPETTGETKNDIFRRRLVELKEKGLNIDYVLFDSWYSALENLKKVRELDWEWFCRLRCNRLVNPDRTKNVPIETFDIPSEGRIVHLKGYGMIKVFKTEPKEGSVEYWATSNLKMSSEDREFYESRGWQIEVYHRGVKQACGLEKSQVRNTTAQKNHIFLSIRAFLRLEYARIKSSISWYEAKSQIIRSAISSYLSHPIYLLPYTA